MVWKKFGRKFLLLQKFFTIVYEQMGSLESILIRKRGHLTSIPRELIRKP